MDPFTGMSQDEMKKLDEVLQSEHAKALLEDSTGKLFSTSKDVPLVSTEDGDVSVLMSTSIESLGGLSDLDNLESTINVPTDEDVANIACEIFHEDLDKPFEIDYVLLDHPYSLPAVSTNYEEVKTSNLNQDLNAQGVKTNQNLASNTLIPTRRSQRQLERAERVQTKSTVQEEEDTQKPLKTELSNVRLVGLALNDDKTSRTGNRFASVELNPSTVSGVNFLDRKTQALSNSECDISKTLKLLSPSNSHVEISPVKPLSAMETIFADSPQEDNTDLTEGLEESDDKFESHCETEKPINNKRRASGEKIQKAPSPEKKLTKREDSASKSSRTKSLSFSEDKTEEKSFSGKKRHSSVSDRETSPIKTIPARPKLKPKKKVQRTESLSADFLGPALFSTPDVMVKVKSQEDSSEKKMDSPESKNEISELDLIKAEMEMDQKVEEEKIQNLKGNSPTDENIVVTASAIKPSLTPKSKEPVQVFQRLPGVRSQKCSPSNIKDFLANKNKAKPAEHQNVSETVKDIELAIKQNHPPETPKPERKSQRTIQKKKRFDDYSPERKVRKKKEPEPQKKATAAAKREPRKRVTKKSAAFDEEDSEESVDSKSDPEATDDADEDSEWDSEDDPERVWCICRKPHNNKFMIQCDKCEDWFHGTCVSVTRQLGRQLEKEGKEWICPKCTKLTPAKAGAHGIQSPRMGQTNQAKQAAKGQKTYLKKDVVKQPVNLPKSQDPRKPESSKIQIANTIAKTNEVPKAHKPIKSITIPEKSDKVSRNTIPKDFVLKSRVPTTPTKHNITKIEKLIAQDVKTDKPALKLDTKGEKPGVKQEARSDKLLVRQDIKNEKPGVKQEMKIERPFVKQDVKTEKPVVKQDVKSERPFVKQDVKIEKLVVKQDVKSEKLPKKLEIVKIEKPIEKVPAKTNNSQHLLSPKESAVGKPNDKFVIREVTFMNNKVVKERKLLAVRKPMSPFPKEAKNEPLISPTKNVNDKPKTAKMNIWKEAKLKEAAKRNYVCVSCDKTAPLGTSYCNNACLEKHAQDSIMILKQQLRPNEDLNSQKVDVIDRETSNLISGANAPVVSELISWLKRNPTFSVVKGLIKKTQVQQPPPQQQQPPPQQQQQQKVEPKSQNVEREDEREDSAIGVRLNVRKTLKKILLDRVENADDIKVTEEEVQKISLKIEAEMHMYFKDNSYKYRTKYRSLMFNIKDPRNQGLFRKILKGEIPPDQLVRMTTEELASVELTKWREKENQHSIDMIKRMQMEQSQVSAGLRKKTHKGEIEIEEEAIVGLDTEIDKEIPKTPPRPIEETIEVTPEKKEIEEKEVSENDTTLMHRSHLFDLNCKICTGKMAPPPPDEPVPKKIRVAHSISVEQTSPKVSEADIRNLSNIVGEVSDDSIELSSTTVSSPDVGSFRRKSKKSESSVWKGFIFMQDVAKFVSSAYKVSGSTDFLYKDIPDTLQVCGRINPQQVWDYLSKIKQSGNKELIVIRFRAANEEEAATYDVFYNYLNSRKRCGVVNNSYSKMVKDFYILPLASHKPVPTVLLPFDGPGLPSRRPHLLLGVLVRHRVKQKESKTTSKTGPDKADEASYTPPLESNSYTPPLETRSYTPPLDNCTYTPPSDNTSYTPPIDDRSYTPPLDEPSYTPPRSGNLEDEGNSSIPPYNPTRSNTFKQESSSETTPTFSQGKKMDEEFEEYEPSYTPPLEKMPKASAQELSYASSSSSMNIISELMKKIAEKSTPSSLAPSASSDLERQKQLLSELTRKVKETDLQVNQSLSDLKQLSSIPQEVQTEGPKSNVVELPAGSMSSFLSMPTKNLQDILNSVKPKAQIEAMEQSRKDQHFSELDSDMRSLFGAGKDTDIRTLPNYSPVGVNDAISPHQVDIDERGSSQDRTPPPSEEMDEDSNTALELRPSDPRIKLRTNFNSDSPKKSLSNMTSSELLERAQKELEAITPSGSYPVPSWDNSKEPPPPGIDLHDIESLMPSATEPTTHAYITQLALPSTPTTPSAFPIPPPCYPLHAPPPLPPGFLPPPNVPPPTLVRPPPAGGLDQLEEHYYAWPPDGPPPDVDYRDRSPHWKHCPPYEEDHPDDWYYGRRGPDDGPPPSWHDGDRYPGHRPRRWYPRRGRGNNQDSNYRGRRNFTRRPPRE